MLDNSMQMDMLKNEIENFENNYKEVDLIYLNTNFNDYCSKPINSFILILILIIIVIIIFLIFEYVYRSNRLKNN
jgi:hypothetical protein